MPRSLLHVLAIALVVSLAPKVQAAPKPAADRKDPAAAEGAFLEAKKAEAALKKDERRRKFRDQWLVVVGRFEQVAERYPKSPHAPEALFEAAELYAELSHVSMARKDVKSAVDAYAHVCERFPGAPQADDAHAALGKISQERKGDPAMAQSETKAAAACKGSVVAKTKAALAALEPILKPKPPERVLRAESPAEEKAEGPREEEAAPAPEATHEEAPSLTLKSADDERPDDAAADPVKIPLAKDLDASRLKALKAASHTDVPLSVQVGLKVKRIIIDAGHGGGDAGAVGPKGAQEKDVTLAVAKRLQLRLTEMGYEALLTRDRDTFVSLEDRARFANKNQGDLFVSVHCNAYHDHRLRGSETYTLNVTSDSYAIRLAARENAASERRVSDLQFILADLATKSNTDDSVRLARAVQSSLIATQSEGGQPKVRDLGVKQALFYVLLGVRMPSVLVETAFITNPDDEKRLLEPGFQQALAESIAEGVSHFNAERDALARASD